MVETVGLENRCTGNRTGGSNPSPSARFCRVPSQTMLRISAAGARSAKERSAHARKAPQLENRCAGKPYRGFESLSLVRIGVLVRELQN